MNSMKYPPCGRFCDLCEALSKGVCKGCVGSEGRPEVIREALRRLGLESCPIWSCAESRGVEHCGECEEFPCERFLSWYNPELGRASLLPYIGLLVVRRKLGEEKWRELAEEYYNWVRT